MEISQRVAWMLFALFATAIHAPAAPPQHALVDQRGSRFTFDHLRGTPLVVTFIAARCRDACPLINAQISAAAHDARSSHGNIRFLTLTLDPKHDTPAVMHRLAMIYDAHAPRWIVASADVETMRALLHRFDVVAVNGSDGVPEMHTTFVYILDKHQRLREALLASPDLPSHVFEAIARL